MSPEGIGAIAFSCIFGGAMVGLFLREKLQEHHLSAESKDVVKLGAGVISTMTAILLGLLVASAKSSFDTQRSELAEMSANIILLDRVLAHYGPQTKEVRERLRGSVEQLIGKIWPGEAARTSQVQPTAESEVLYDKLQQLTPETDAQRALQSEALKLATDLGQMRWLLFAQSTSAISTPFLTVVIFWLTVTFTSFGLFAPRNVVVFITLLVCTLSVAGALSLVLELDTPFGGFIQISSEPMRNALAQLGR